MGANDFFHGRKTTLYVQSGFQSVQVLINIKLIKRNI
jgi:hypothetical protein